MAFCCSRMLVSRQLNQGPSLLRGLYTAPKTMATMKVVPFKEPPREGHDERNMRLKRPLSPHLLIYSPQLTSMLSITHRGTGVALSVYVAGLGIGSLVLPQSIPAYLAGANLSAATIFAGKFILAFPFAYHFCNGLRHLVWDFGKQLTIKEVYTTGYIMVGMSAIVTLLLMKL